MNNISLKRIMALVGVGGVIAITFILAVVFLALGNAPMAITFVAINGFISIILFFVLRFHGNVVDANPPEVTNSDDDSMDNDTIDID